MPRYKLKIEFDGTPFVGWQFQDNGPSVQGCLMEAVFAFAGERVAPSGAGRTDAGVHASGQVAHVDLAKDWPANRVREALNHHLRPNPIAVIDCEVVADDFDARHSATARHYRYCIIDRRAPLTFKRHIAWHVPRPLDATAMQAAAQVLLGRHDFTTFRSVHCQSKSAIKTLDELNVQRDGEQIIIRTKAQSFMHNQVRSMVGSLLHVGEGKWSEQDLIGALDAADRTRCGVVAPAHGLCLTGVDY